MTACLAPPLPKPPVFETFVAISRPVTSVGQASGWDAVGLPVDTPTIGAAVLERTGMGMAKEK